MKRVLYLIIGLAIGGGAAFATDAAYAAGASKPAPKVDCSLKKNAKKIECKEAPKSDVKPKIKAPPKVDRKAPASVQKKADAENAKK
jgi:hypothetical protein